VREDRERQIEAAGEVGRARPAAQPGLFDRRVERSLVAQASASTESAGVSAGRLGAILTAAQMAPRPARLLLVLVPWS